LDTHRHVNDGTGNLIHEGKAKLIYSTDSDNNVRMKFKDSLTAGDGAKKDRFDGKGVINAAVTSVLFQSLNDHGIDTHFLEQESRTELICSKVTILPLEVVVRNISAGSFTRRYGISEGTTLSVPVVELFLKDDELHDPLITDDVAVALDHVTGTELSYIKTIALQVNKILQSLFDKMNLVLIDFKLEFGKTSDNRILLADEITQDTIRVWDKTTGEKKDKDRFRRDLGNVKETYQEFLAGIQEQRMDNRVPLLSRTRVMIELKDGIIDSVGDVTRRSLHRLGFSYITNIRSGKTMTIITEGPLNSRVMSDLQEMNSKLLSNPLVEKATFSFSIM